MVLPDYKVDLWSCSNDSTCIWTLPSSTFKATKMQRAILALGDAGFFTPDIADLLGISEKSVKEITKRYRKAKEKFDKAEVKKWQKSRKIEKQEKLSWWQKFKREVNW